MGTPDYFNSCASGCFYPVGVPSNFVGFQNAKTGAAYSGISVSTFLYGESREYLSIKLKDSLISGIKYYLSLYITLADSIRYATDAIGIYLSTDSIFSNNYMHLPYTPQITNMTGNYIIDRQNWIQLSGEYISQGGEKYITIGNFKDDTTTPVLFVTGGGDSIPNNNTIYYYIDDVCLSPSPDTCNILTVINSNNIENIFNISPNPAIEHISIKIPQNEKGIVKIIDFLGKPIKIKDIINSPDDKINIKNFHQGIYFVSVQTSNQLYSQKLIIIH